MRGARTPERHEPSPTGGRSRGLLLRATTTPLASIFGSGFLIIVPVLERSLGPLAVLGAALVCAVAWWAGTAVRHNVRHTERQTCEGRLDRTTHRIEEAADAIIVVAYVISVALYLRIMAQYVIGAFDDGGSPGLERLLAMAGVGVIVLVGVTRGFGGLDLLERVSLVAVLALVVLLSVAIGIDDGHAFLTGALDLPPRPDESLWQVLRVLGGTVITVQGFETVRYLGDTYDADTRVVASRVAQVTATVVYVGFVLLATPLMGLGTPDGPDDTLIQVTDRVLPLLAVPLVVAAVLSQFSAATADTAAAEGNLTSLVERVGQRTAYLASGAVAVLLAATVPTFTIVAVASRAFALYYAMQAIVALRTCEGTARKAGYAALAVLMLAITVLAVPAG